MKKVQLFIIILIVIILFVAGDYFVNAPGSIKITDITNLQNNKVEDHYPDLVQELLNINDGEIGYKVVKRERSIQIFEKFDLATMDNTAIFLNTLKSTAVGTPVIIYEIHTKKNQGALAFHSLKLKIIDQIGERETVNEVTDYGYNAFFYNDPDNENTGYLVSQIKDNLFGFQYSKADENSFKTIRTMINALMQMDLLL